ncbi:sugar-binding protein [Exilibacterium tricleocarpae]|uniref:Sugar-binding protein n=1 Tax=Exilibacterium tricleocarpae TaxID=2591008 RepID=A0A545TLS8_9GAMM|nr:sugar-binding protein [Exilibacterium tricleocarpae]TQV78182.1 sugar-binding protein [Exilibacterium tricleocarpae]
MRLPLITSALLIAGGALAFEAPRTATAPVIDGDPSDAAWQQANWRELDQRVLGSMPSPTDFSGRYKLVWTPAYLYLLAEIDDDILIDARADPLVQYWDDDTLEIFIDEDASGGNHLEDFNAFAYHIALDNQAVDIAPSRGQVSPRLFPGHIEARWRRSVKGSAKAEATAGTQMSNSLYWEVRIAVHNDSHVYGDDLSSRVTLAAGKKLGFMVAYCDADDARGRQHFMGDVAIKPVDGDRNRGYIDASVFGELTLVE